MSDDQYEGERKRLFHGDKGQGPRDQNGWGEYKLLVVHELRRLNDELEELEGIVDAQGRDLLTLKVKASIWGAVAGFVMSMLPTIVRIFNIVSK